jgi:cytochrome c oxidase subunit II
LIAWVEPPAGAARHPHTKWAWRLTAKWVICEVGLLCLAAVAGCHKPAFTGPPDQRIHLLIKQWEMVPRKIVVARGVKVELIIESADVEHGLSVPGLDIDESVKKGETVAVRFIAVKSGEYAMHCSILCGRGHDEMKGKILVEVSQAE